jgi:hypothetical protein
LRVRGLAGGDGGGGGGGAASKVNGGIDDAGRCKRRADAEFVVTDSGSAVQCLVGRKTRV